MSDKLRLRLLEPGMREAIREARVRLDAEDQRWMMGEIERLENKTKDLRGEAERLRKERNDWRAKAEGKEPLRRPKAAGEGRP